MAQPKKYRLLKDKDFLEELHAYADEQRRLMEAECDGFATDATARDIRRTRAHKDYEFFCKTYFPHYVKSEASAFHKWFFVEVPKLIDKPTGQRINVSAHARGQVHAGHAAADDLAGGHQAQALHSAGNGCPGPGRDDAGGGEVELESNPRWRWTSRTSAARAACGTPASSSRAAT